jgi:hypothetical protein
MHLSHLREAIPSRHQTLSVICLLGLRQAVVVIKSLANASKIFILMLSSIVHHSQTTVVPPEHSMARLQIEYSQADFRLPKLCSPVSKRLALRIDLTGFSFRSVLKTE